MLKLWYRQPWPDETNSAEIVKAESSESEEEDNEKESNAESSTEEKEASQKSEGKILVTCSMYVLFTLDII